MAKAKALERQYLRKTSQAKAEASAEEAAAKAASSRAYDEQEQAKKDTDKAKAEEQQAGKEKQQAELVTLIGLAVSATALTLVLCYGLCKPPQTQSTIDGVQKDALYMPKIASKIVKQYKQKMENTAGNKVEATGAGLSEPLVPADSP